MNPYAGRTSGDVEAPTARLPRLSRFPYIEPRPARLMPVITPAQVAADIGREAAARIITEREFKTWPAPAKLPPAITVALAALRPELLRLGRQAAELLENIDAAAERLAGLEMALRAQGIHQ